MLSCCVLVAQERMLYLRFVWGRSRLPLRPEEFAKKHKIKKDRSSRGLNRYPVAHTCFFSLDLPPYSSDRVMRDRLLFAVTNCKSIDADDTSAAREAAGATWADSDSD